MLFIKRGARGRCGAEGRSKPRSEGRGPDPARADAANARAGAGAEGDALDGVADEAGEDERGPRRWVGRRAVVVRLQMVAGQEPPHAGADGGEDLDQIVSP